MRRFLLLPVVAAVALAAASCGPPATSSQQQLGGRPGGSQVVPNRPGPIDVTSPGQTVFAAQNCTRCHPAPGVTGQRTSGPDLAKAGAKHDKAWIADHIRDAKKHTPMSKMPAYPEEKLTAKDLDTLADFLAGLK